LDPELLSVLASYPQLTDIHIHYPRPGVGKRNYNDVTIADARKILRACPNVYRVGIGNKNVWERHTPSNRSEDDDEYPQIHLLEEECVPEFYDAGSGGYPGDGRDRGGRDEASVSNERDLFLDLLKSLSS
jgi:hypothetical protein